MLVLYLGPPYFMGMSVSYHGIKCDMTLGGSLRRSYRLVVLSFVSSDIWLGIQS